MIAEARPVGASQGDQEPGRDRRPPRRPGARRRRARRASCTGCRSRRPRAASTRLKAAAKLEQFRQAERRSSRPQLRHHFRRRPERRDRPLPGERGDQPAARDWTRSTWSIRAANIRTAPPTSPAPCAIGTPTRRDARPLHPRAQGPYRDRHARVFPEGTRGAPARQLRPPAPVGRPASITPMAPAMASAPSSPSTKGRSASRRPEAARPAATSRSSAGMILSNEPGYYKTGEYGIRIENLVLVVAGRGRRRRKERCSASRR